MADYATANEPYAYLLREGNSDFRDFLNNTIQWSILRGAFNRIYQKWMGPSGVCAYKMPLTFKEYLDTIVYPMQEDWWKE